jgi:enoyl-CoA hydratase/carnithine racemase
LNSSGDRQLHIRRDARPEGVIAHVIIDNAGKLNAINSALMGELVTGMGELAADERLRAVVLTGAGPKAFIAGVDIDEMARIENSAQATAFITRLHQGLAAIRDVPVPVIARIQGYTFGGGLELAAACDVRIAADTALFGMPEVKLGIPSVIEAALLPTLVGWGRAREIMYLGENFTADEALQWGLVEHVVPVSALDAAVEAWIAKLLTSAPRAVRLQKKLIRRWEDLPLAAAVQAGIEAFGAAYVSDEPRTVMREFLAARQARKKGR